MTPEKVEACNNAEWQLLVGNHPFETAWGLDASKLERFNRILIANREIPPETLWLDSMSSTPQFSSDGGRAHASKPSRALQREPRFRLRRCRIRLQAPGSVPPLLYSASLRCWRQHPRQSRGYLCILILISCSSTGSPVSCRGARMTLGKASCSLLPSWVLRYMAMPRFDGWAR